MDFNTARNSLIIETFTLSQLLNLVDQVSGEVKGASPNDTYLLFSGNMPDGTHTSEVIPSLLGNGVHDIGDSEIGKLLAYEGFNVKLKAAIATEEFHFNWATATLAEQLQVEERFNFLKSGVNAAGERVSSTSIWDIGSHNFVAAAKGNFRILTPTTVDQLSVFVTSELPALLSNGNVTHIDGVPRTELAALASREGLDAARNAIHLRSAEIAHFTSLGSGGGNLWLSLDDAELSAARQNQVLLTSWAQRHQATFSSPAFKLSLIHI